MLCQECAHPTFIEPGQTIVIESRHEFWIRQSQWLDGPPQGDLLTLEYSAEEKLGRLTLDASATSRCVGVVFYRPTLLQRIKDRFWRS